MILNILEGIKLMSTPLEEPYWTTQKRFLDKHYSYRDSLEATTQVLNVLQLATLNALIARIKTSYTTIPAIPLQVLGVATRYGIYYTFGTNAQAIDMHAWPYAGDKIGPSQSAFQTYAKEVSIICTQAAYVRLVSLNPEYLRLAAKAAYIKGPINVPQYNIEVEQYVAANNQPLTLKPTYGLGIIYRAATVAGTLHVAIEGNVEGHE